ncbi:hypothetical protein ACHAXT_011193 [Thalassiosira profunda]
MKRHLLLLLAPSTAEAFVPTAGHKRPRPPTTLEVEPAAIAGAVATAGGLAWWLGGADERAKRANNAEWEAMEKERERLASIEPREVWREEELAPYDGTQSDTGPILLAIKGDVFNVAKGRGFYGPGSEYHIMAGRDATRFLAKNRLEEERDEERGAALNIAERANLEAWYWQLKNKYPRVGRLEGYDPSSTDM